MASSPLKRYLPLFITILALAVVAWLYALPALTGKELTQSDNINWQGMSHEASKEFAETGKPVLWTNSMFGGMPTYTFYLGATANHIQKVEGFLQTIFPKPGYFFFIAMLGFFLLMRALNINRWLAAIGALAYAFSTYNPIIIAAGHDTKMLAMGYMPGVIAGVLFIYQGRYLMGAALAGVLFALMFQNQHAQILYYMAMMMLCMGVVLLYIAIREKQLKRFAIATLISVVVLGIGAGPGMPQFLTTIEYSKYSMRGGKSELTINHDQDKKTGGLDKDYAFQWSNSPGETWCLLVPYLYGGGSSEAADKAPETSAVTGREDGLPTYWGPQPFLSGPVYFGAIICFLFVLGLIVVRSPHKWWIAGVSALAILMSWGSHLPGLNYWLFDHLPMMNKFRTPSMDLVIPQLLFPVLGIWGVQDILKNYSSPETRAELAKKILIAAGITGGLALVLGVGGSMFFDFSNPATEASYPAEIVNALKSDRETMARNSGLVSALLIALSGGLMWLYAKDRVKANVLTIGLGLLVAADMLPTSWRYLNESNYSDAQDYDANFQPRPADVAVDQLAKQRGDGEYYRVLDISKNVYNDATQAYFHKCVGGYNPAKLEIYQDLIDVHMSKGFNPAVLNMLNTRYIIQSPEQQGVSVNLDACGNAWFVSAIKQVNTADEEILSMSVGKPGDTVVDPSAFNPRETAIVRKDFADKVGGIPPGRDSSANVKLAKYGLNEISYSSNNSREGLAVFSDIWYPAGWKAYVDDKEVPIIRANYVLRALRLPAGQHKIDFRFHPDSFYTGNAMAGVSSLLLYLLLAAGIFAMVKDARKDDPEETPVPKKS